MYTALVPGITSGYFLCPGCIVHVVGCGGSAIFERSRGPFLYAHILRTCVWSKVRGAEQPALSFLLGAGESSRHRGQEGRDHPRSERDSWLPAHLCSRRECPPRIHWCVRIRSWCDCETRPQVSISGGPSRKQHHFQWGGINYFGGRTLPESLAETVGRIPHCSTSSSFSNKMNLHKPKCLLSVSRSHASRKRSDPRLQGRAPVCEYITHIRLSVER